MSATKIFFSSQVDDGDPPFPRPAGYWWFGCNKTSQQLKQKDSHQVVNIQADQRLDVPLGLSDQFDVSEQSENNSTS